VTARVGGTVRVCDNCGSDYQACEDQEAVCRGLVENYCPWCGYPQDLDGEAPVDTEWCTVRGCVRPVTYHPDGLHLTENGREFTEAAS